MIEVLLYIQTLGLRLITTCRINVFGYGLDKPKPKGFLVL